jgi:hypothetical protein
MSLLTTWLLFLLFFNSYVYKCPSKQLLMLSFCLVKTFPKEKMYCTEGEKLKKFMKKPFFISENVRAELEWMRPSWDLANLGLETRR